jgi:hypothetical protein
MQEFIPQFSNTMSWLILGLALVSLTLFGLEARRLPQGRRRASLGVLAMIGVLITTTASLIGLAAHSTPQHHGPFLSQLLLPLVAAVLLSTLYQISFPPSEAIQAPHHARKTLLLLVLSAGAVLSAIGLVVLDFLFS